ncbi:MAG: putative rane protein [Acidimicrobiia bacterium]|nr:putative rane protein [Acidimicrobiia bacterium]
MVVVTRAQDRHETRLLSGTFTLFAAGLNKSCVGPAGYDDISTRTPVVVKDSGGHKVAQDGLGEGVLIRAIGACRYGFEMPVPSGSDSYTVSVGKRGQATVSWADIDLPCAIDISYGAPKDAAAVSCRPSAMVAFVAPASGVAGHPGASDDEPGYYDTVTVRVASAVSGKHLWLLRRDANGDTWVVDRLSSQTANQTLEHEYLFGPDDRGHPATLLVVAVNSTADRHFGNAQKNPIPSPVSMRGTKVLASRGLTCCSE